MEITSLQIATFYILNFNLKEEALDKIHKVLDELLIPYVELDADDLRDLPIEMVNKLIYYSSNEIFYEVNLDQLPEDGFKFHVKNWVNRVLK